MNRTLNFLKTYLEAVSCSLSLSVNEPLTLFRIPCDYHCTMNIRSLVPHYLFTSM